MQEAASSFAANAGISGEEALDRLLVQDIRFEELASTFSPSGAPEESGSAGSGSDSEVDASDALFAFVAATLGESFGGLWYDHDNGGRLTIDVTTRDAAREDAIRQSFAQPSWITFRQVDYSLAELQAARAEAITLVGAQLTVAGWQADVVAVQEDLNRVVVHASPKNETSESGERPQSLDPRIVVVRSEGPLVATACSNRDACSSPMRGGILLLRSDGGSCSSGVPVRSIHTGARGVLTAGHCAARGTRWRHNGRNFGTMVFSDERHQLMDIGVVQDDTSNFSVADWIYHSDGVQELTTGGWYQGNNIARGTIVCNSGARTGGPECRNTNSGNAQITTTTTTNGQAVTYENQLWVYGCGREGDSGSPFYRTGWDNTARRSFAYPIGTQSHGEHAGDSDCSRGGWVSGAYLVHIRNHTGFQPF